MYKSLAIYATPLLLLAGLSGCSGGGGGGGGGGSSTPAVASSMQGVYQGTSSNGKTKVEEMWNLLLALVSLLALAIPSAYAQDSGGFAADHLLNKLKIQECRLTYTLGTSKASSGEVSAIDAYETYLKCKGEANSQLAATHKKMSAKFKSSSQKVAVKDYRVAMGLALEGSEPRDNELKIQYEARLARLDEDVERAWQRLTVE
jgi:hypothetical protein